MLALLRAVAYSAGFVGLVLVYLPARFLSGLSQPVGLGLRQIAGMAVAAMGAALASWCTLTFASVGKGTPAPFDPPRRLVTRGPYRFVRNPMDLGGGLTLAGAALFFGSWPLLAYSGLYFWATHLFIVRYEEPTLRKTFGPAYQAYARRVWRRWPSVRRAGPDKLAG
jgi:protein-S-isoprenylcysteine O-methyltransferase Ste14